MSTVILAPAAAGKSTWLRTHRPTFAVDGDAVIARSIGWPTGPRWWEASDADAVQARNWAAIIGHAEGTGQIILFNGVPHRGENQHLVLVSLPAAQVRERLTAARDTKRPVLSSEYEQNLKMLEGHVPERLRYRSFEHAYRAALTLETRNRIPVDHDLWMPNPR